MTRDRSRNDERSRIAHYAARIMAEDGVEDYALAKRKAARQAGVPDTRQLPTNEEIDEALHTHQALYQPDEHRLRLRELRAKALRAMNELSAFNPYLTGSVLTGSAGKYADINLHLYTDNMKGVELYLIEQRIPYKTTQMRLHVADEVRIVPVFTLEDRGTEIRLVVLTARDLRVSVRTSSEGKAIERAKLQAVELFLAET
jgi:hypothetical protein